MVSANKEKVDFDVYNVKSDFLFKQPQFKNYFEPDRGPAS